MGGGLGASGSLGSGFPGGATNWMDKPYGGNWFSGGTPAKTGGPAGTTNTNEFGVKYGWNPGAAKLGGTGGPVGTTNTNAFGKAYGWNPGAAQLGGTGGPAGTTNTNQYGVAYGWNPTQQTNQKPPAQWVSGGYPMQGGGWDISQAFQHLFGGGGAG